MILSRGANMKVGLPPPRPGCLGMDKAFLAHLHKETDDLRAAGLYKTERIITSPQQAAISVQGDTEVLNFCANNYLGLANHPVLVDAAKKALDRYGFGMSSVRFICGTQEEHKQLENRLSSFLGTEDTILYSSCFDANTGLFETLLDERDAIISDALNHASIIDGIRLCKARRLRYANNDMKELEAQLKDSQDCRFRLIATDGVFSMDGVIANLPAICDLANEYNAMIMVDDSHAVGVLGARGRGTPEHWRVQDRIDIVTGTLGKALGGASGGYTSARQEIVEWLRQRSRPYLFSNTLAPVVAATSLAALDLLEGSDTLRTRLIENGHYFRTGLQQLGFTLVEGEHPIVPVMLGEAALAQQMAERLLKQGIYVIGFSFPVVPNNKARIRVQLSAAHERDHLDRAIAAFATVGRDLGVID